MYANNNETPTFASESTSSGNEIVKSTDDLSDEDLASNSEMQKLILKVNEMQDVCSKLGTSMQFELPQIAVIGSQSAGKSSVLENIVGREFLPRGNGVVTRRPLVLQLVHGPKEYGEFGHNKERQFNNFSDICSEIEAETSRKAGNNKGMSADPIQLTIHSPNVMNLSLVDLPGITKVPIGDQPPNIEQIVNDMISQYIRNENCLILAVSPANNDLANSDALKLAREVDPDGQRTIGVITKLDMMDAGTNAMDIFEGRLLPLRRGYIGVVNRSQKEIEQKKDIVATLKRERHFFETHPNYHRIAERLGTPYLQKVLNHQLTLHIREKLPALQDKTRKRMVNLEKETAEYEKLHPDDPKFKKDVMLDVIRKLQKEFEREMGTLGENNVSTTKLSSGALIRRIFLTRLPREMSKIGFNEIQLRQEIKTTIENLYGRKCGDEIPFNAFEATVRKQVFNLERPITVCVDAVFEELANAVRTSTQHISNFPQFRDCIESYIMSFVHRNSLSHLQDVLSLAKMEAAYMNTKHPEYNNNTPSNSSSTESLTKVKNRTDSVILAGHISVEIEEGLKTEYRFLLESNALKCSLKKYSLASLAGVKVRVGDGSTSALANTITLFRPDGANVVQDFKELKLIYEDVNEYVKWKQAFEDLLNDNVEEFVIAKDDDLSPDDKDVDIVYNKIGSYMRIVKKTLCDMVPKAITLFIIKRLEDFINQDLLKIVLGSLEDDENYLAKIGPSEEDMENYKAKKRTYESCKKALEVMRI